MRRSMPSVQAPAAVLMVRPRHFHPNPQTAADNAFQRTEAGRDASVQRHMAARVRRLAGGSVRCMLAEIHLARR
ncbi:hypothetical protein BH11PSE8_BH11PSE8_26500 [soil metagenome]